MIARFFGITADYVESFLYSSFPEPTPVLRRLGKYGEEQGIPIVGPLVGRLLHLIVKIAKARSVLEIGTAIGYSTIWLASALPYNGVVSTIEINEKAVEIAKKSIKDAKLAEKVRFLVGDAAKIVPSLNGKFDVVFLDTDKLLYPRLLPKLVELLNLNSVLVADNALWGGRVATNDRSGDTAAIRQFDKKIIEDGRLFSVIVPIRDGVSVSLKLHE